MIKRLSIALVVAALCISALAVFLGGWGPAVGEAPNPDFAGTSADGNGQQIHEIVVSGKPPDVKVPTARVPEPNIQMGINVLSEVPAFDWSYGCSATSAAMLFGYYDRTGYSNMYAGPTNGGVCPLNNSVWGESVSPGNDGECPLSATHQGTDNLTLKGHVDDYWINYGNAGPDPYVVGSWTEHEQADCTGDFMGTNQSKFGNVDGGTMFYFYNSGAPLYDFTDYEPGSRDGCHGLRLFAESRGYTVETNFNQYIQAPSRPLGFTFVDFTDEIDAGRPVLIQVTGHTMLGYGYNTDGQKVYIRNTWDHESHEMTWGGIYEGMQHKGVSVIRLEPPAPPTVSTNPAVEIGTVTATLNGSLIGLGTPPLVEVSFEWGLTAGYGNTTAPQTTTSTGTFSDSISSLTPGTTYHFRAVAVGDGTVYGGDIIFSTLEDYTAPAVPALLSPANWQQINSSYILDWADVADPSGVTYDIRLYDLYWSLAGEQTGLADSACALSSFGALADGAYYWVVRAVDGATNASDWTASWAFGLDNVPPASPSQVSPADGHATADTTPSLDWSDVSDPSGMTYRLQIAEDSGFSSLVLDRDGLLTSEYTLAEVEALADGAYYWRVCAVEEALNQSAWTGAWSFTVDTTAPPVPVLKYYADGKITADNTPWLNWSDVTDATAVTYRLQVDDNPDFSSTVVNKSTGSWSSNTLPVLSDGDYYWRVRAVDAAGNESAWTSSRSFTVDTTAPPVPVLEYYADGKVTADNTPWLNWSDVTDATAVRYWLQVDDDADFSSPEVDKCTYSWSSNTLPVLSDGVYYWRARAVDAAGNASAWTGSRSFTVDTTPPPVPVLEYYADGTITADNTPWLNWSDVTDATAVRYWLQVDDDADFSPSEVDKCTYSWSSNTLPVLADGVYYWRVRAVDAAGNASDWSDVWSFTVAT